MLIADASQSEIVTLESKELIYLTDLLGADRLLGKEGPFRGFLLKEMDENWEHVRESLIQKGYLTPRGSKDMLTVPMHVMSRLVAASLADKACWVKYRAGTETYEQFLHIADECVVKVERSKDNPALHQLDEISEVRNVCGSLAGKMMWNAHCPGELPALMLSRRQFAEVIRQLDDLDMEDVMVELLKITDDQEGVISLANCLKTHVAQGDIRFFAWNGDQWESQHAQFINNHSINWLFRSSTKADEDWLIATPTQKDQFQEMLLHWFREPCEQVQGRQ
ncbi:hypothetical protein [Paenibacillus woosongensis]|uniref:Uncharacterized protein n=1 Tax=Paenibacillus woosongensis TaxID=307580 RepID=A0A7X2Z249_9BACL|nr:hypothetical protein [Paenibacillus woosongensis]MUG45668.1 hypothetical protein [Paenibacillus woosongensis]